MRIGHGYDVHKFQEGLPLILGGVKIEHPFGLLGHSDADVLLHAIMDALLGAAALGDIGTHFPDSDPKYKGANSLKLLASTCDMIKNIGYKIINIDSTLVLQEPRIKPYKNMMCENIAKTCNIEIDAVNVKATTEEGLGFTGEKLGIAAHAVCLLEKI